MKGKHIIPGKCPLAPGCDRTLNLHLTKHVEIRKRYLPPICIWIRMPILILYSSTVLGPPCALLPFHHRLISLPPPPPTLSSSSAFLSHFSLPCSRPTVATADCCSRSLPALPLSTPPLFISTRRTRPPVPPAPWMLSGFGRLQNEPPFSRFRRLDAGVGEDAAVGRCRSRTP